MRAGGSGLRAAAGAPRIAFHGQYRSGDVRRRSSPRSTGATGIIAISKSGGTAETLIAARHRASTALRRQARHGRGRRPHHRHHRAARQSAAQAGDALKMRDPGSRSRDRRPVHRVLAMVGPAAGNDRRARCAALREGAASVLDRGARRQRHRARPRAGARRGACGRPARTRTGINITVMMPYVDRLATFGFWFRQLWAESLGKDGKGTTPIRAWAPVDQHSQLQLYLARPGRQAVHPGDRWTRRAGHAADAGELGERSGAGLSRRPEAWATCSMPKRAPPRQPA